MIHSLLAQRRAETQLRAAFRDLGAVTPANARPGKELPVMDADTFDSLLRRGVIREGAPGTYYLYEPKPARSGWVRRAIFWLAVLIIPVTIIQFCSASP